ncbi:: Laminin_G_3 [Gemmata massiliana]|uniref:: Laminin_G_3 n=1 Tax=Gemmata massiliana TaxID=1210884 RepID=A0A6P2CQY6_9BACT|nr:LamG-like jellyroll fold domain-containing protein [Gemmata massiliana]VTR90977.1 : Laminin_G_3 [Gemmata massiliana]
MPIEFVCPTCNGTLRVEDDFAGRVIRCGSCQTMLRVPNEPNAPDSLTQSVVPVAPPGVPAPRVSENTTDPNQSLFRDADPYHAPDRHPDFELSSRRRNRDRDDSYARPRDRDRDDERPRHRRRPSAPPGRGVFFWLVVCGGLLVLFTFGCCGGLYLLLPGAKWQKHESVKGGFKVDLPAAPRDDLPKLAGKERTPGVQMEGTILIGRAEEFAVVYGDTLPAGQQFGTDQQQIDEAVKGMQSTGDVRAVLSQKNITVGGFPAREVEFSAKSGGWYVSRIVVADGRVYVVIAGGRFARPGNENARRFLDSFEITDPRLKAAGQKRAEDAKRADEETRLQKERAERERAERQKEEERLATEKRTAEEVRRRAAEASAARFQTARPGQAPPDPNDLPGLVLHLPCEALEDKATPVFPNGAATVPVGTVLGPGVRGNAVYLPARPDGVSPAREIVPPELLASDKTVTVAGWIKVRNAACDLVTVHATPQRDPRAPQFGAGVTDRRVRAFDRALADIHRTELVAPQQEAPLSAGWAPDEKWHHLAVTRRAAGSRVIITLYLDGAPVAAYPFGTARGEREDQLVLTFGQSVPLRALTGRSDLHLPEQLKGAAYDVPDPDLPVSAIDDVCAFTRALTEPEIRYLAGTGPRPPAGTKPVRLVPEATIDANNGVAFDPTRETVWAVTAVDGYWRAGTRPKNGAEKQSYLRAHSYPDFKPGPRYLLPEYRDQHGLGGAPVLDPKSNRLYLPIGSKLREGTNLQRRAEADGPVQAFDLGALSDDKEGQPLRPERTATGTAPAGEVLDLVLSPNGARVYRLDMNAPQPGDATKLPPGYEWRDVRAHEFAADLKGQSRIALVPRNALRKGPLWVSPDGKKFRAMISEAGGPFREAGVLEVDVATWQSKVLPLPGGHSSAPQSAAWHPDGRLFVSDGPRGIWEFNFAAGTKRYRAVPVGTASYVCVSADGRYLVASDSEAPAAVFGLNADQTKNRIVILDAAREPVQLGELAALEETPDLRIGGPCWPSPDGRFIVFRSGAVLRIDDGRPPLPKPGLRLPVAPPPHERKAQAPPIDE